LDVTNRITGGGVGRNPFGVQWTGGKAEAGSVGEQVQDNLFGKPKPKVLDQDDADCAHLLARLHPYRKRLARLAGDSEADYRFLLSSGTIAAVDQEGTIYVGKAFLLELASSLPTQVGVIAHEIGHRPRRWREYKEGRVLGKVELEDLCRLEETRADYFSGWALAQLGLPCEPLCTFLEAIQIHPHPEYFSAELRTRTIREGADAGARRQANLQKFFPELARMTSARGDLGSG
jgi:hypothetical protein